MNRDYLETAGLAVGYGGTPLIQEISLHLRRGQILTLIGPNGAGKSTILRSILRQLAPMGGAVYLDGREMAAQNRRELAKKIASVLPGRPDAELMTVEDVVSAGRYPYTGAFGLLSAEDRTIVRDSMALVRVEELALRPFSRLSDGQRQRVLLARALCQQPELLVLDEPTSFLDIRYKLEFLSLLRRLAREQNLAVLLSLHELELAERVSDTVACVAGDKMGRIGPPSEIFTKAYLTELFRMEPGGYDACFDTLPYAPGTDDLPAQKRYITSGGKQLRCGYTTGTCAALAAQAAAHRLLLGVWPRSVSLRTPKGWPVEVVPENHSYDGTTAACAVRKDAGDDSDRTDGLPICAAVSLMESPGITIEGGPGIGRVTKPGLDQPAGEWAINSVPRRMIRDAVSSVCRTADYTGGVRVCLSVPGGEEAAAHTFNPHLGIEGGISILGTSGVVEPMSEQALLDAISVEIRQAAALGGGSVILTPGSYGLAFLREHGINPPEIPVVRISNFIGDCLDACGQHGMREVLLVGHAGKLVKLAGGIMNTHSHMADCRTELFCTHAALCGAGPDTCRALLDCATADACIELLDTLGLRESVMESLLDAIGRRLTRRADGKFRVGAILFSNRYGELGRTAEAKEMIRKWNTEPSMP